jgi:hypothetical protein
MVTHWQLRRGAFWRRITERTALRAFILSIVPVGLLAVGHAQAAERRILDLRIEPVTDIHSGYDASVRSLADASSFRSGEMDGPEIAIRAGALGLSLSPENNRLKPDVFYDVSGWRLRTRIMSGDSPLEIDGMVLRAAHTFPLFKDSRGSADLP